MPEFIFVAVVLVLLAAVFLLTPVMMKRGVHKSSRSGINVALYKDRLAELQQDLNNELIDASEFEQLSSELQRRLLDEAAGSDADVDATAAPSIKLPLAICVFVALFGTLVYQYTGAKPDWEIAQTLQQARHNAAAGESTEADVTRLLQQLQQRLQQRPADPHYLMLLAGTEMDRENYPAATDAYQRLAALHPEDPSILARYAQALYLASDRTLSPQVKMIADQALAINPQQPTVLGMMGIASFEQGDYQKAIDYWQRLLPMLGPVSPNRQMISAGIEQAKAKLVEAGVAVAETPTVAAASTSAASLDVEVSIGKSIKADSNAIVFVFARAVAGPRMPLAVARIRVADLPAKITLDDSMAMAPGLKLSSFEQVEVVARISKNGIANPGSGDIEGKLGPIELATTSGALSVLINQIVP
jgi:cytochrome c-type biogenesis protein CcmH